MLAAALAGCGGRTALDGAFDGAPDGGERFSPRDAGMPDAGGPDARPPVDGGCEPELTIELVPSARLQIAVWVEGPDGRFETIALTEAVARRGIGNRPGASQMNSGYHWPWGRRESVLPRWAHQRLAHGRPDFPRVVFQDRPEGFAARSGASEPPGVSDAYFCLGFSASTSDRDHLDAITCASEARIDRGRFLTESEVAAGYAEPFEDRPGLGTMRPLSLRSAYPPRTDLSEAAAGDHDDVGRFRDAAMAAMPTLDAITMATPSAGSHTSWTWRPPGEGTFEVFVEVSSEGDYGGAFPEGAWPTPNQPDGEWDYWSQSYGYAYRGQPSVVFTATIEAGREGAVTAERPLGRTALDGLSGDLSPADDVLDDPVGAPGSGADRLLRQPDGARLRVRSGCR